MFKILVLWGLIFVIKANLIHGGFWNNSLLLDFAGIAEKFAENQNLVFNSNVLNDLFTATQVKLSDSGTTLLNAVDSIRNSSIASDAAAAVYILLNATQVTLGDSGTTLLNAVDSIRNSSIASDAAAAVSILLNATQVTLGDSGTTLLNAVDSIRNSSIASDAAAAVSILLNATQVTLGDSGTTLLNAVDSIRNSSIASDAAAAVSDIFNRTQGVSVDAAVELLNATQSALINLNVINSSSLFNNDVSNVTWLERFSHYCFSWSLMGNTSLLSIEFYGLESIRNSTNFHKGFFRRYSSERLSSDNLTVSVEPSSFPFVVPTRSSIYAMVPQWLLNLFHCITWIVQSIYFVVNGLFKFFARVYQCINTIGQACSYVVALFQTSRYDVTPKVSDAKPAVVSKDGDAIFELFLVASLVVVLWNCRKKSSPRTQSTPATYKYVVDASITTSSMSVGEGKSYKDAVMTTQSTTSIPKSVPSVAKTRQKNKIPPHVLATWSQRPQEPAEGLRGRGYWEDRAKFRGNKSFGMFYCGQCGNQWLTAHAFKDYWQACKKCETKLYSTYMWTNFDNKNHRDILLTSEEDLYRGPHDQKRCQKCILLKQGCWM